jgi:EmrB/QacA subfamily drug resistance transporter
MAMTRQQRWTMVAVILGSAIVFLDTSIVNLANPTIADELDSALFSKLEAQSYVTNAYFLTLSSLLILAGALADYHGRRKMFRIGLIGFLVTSMMCALAPTMEFLIGSRVLQGAAGALVVPGSLAIITATFQGEQRGRAFGIWAGASAATSILGPTVGGFLVDGISWRAAFFINLPFLLLATYAVRFVHESRDEESTGHFDWLGSVVAVVAVGGIAFGTIRGGQKEWQAPEAWVALGVGLVALIAFPILMVKRDHPLVPPSLFRSRNFTVTNLSTFVIYGALYVYLAFLSYFLIGTLRYSASAAAVAGIPATIFLVLFSTKFGRLAARYGPRLFMALGPAIMGVGLLWLARIPADSASWTFGVGEGKSLVPPVDYLVDLLPANVIFGVGLMIMVAPLTTALMGSIPERNAGVGSAINNAISRVGSPLITALIFVVVVSGFYRSIEEQVPGVDTSSAEFRQEVAPLNPPDEGADPALVAAATEASTEAFHLAAGVAAALLLIGAAVNGIGIRNPRKEDETEGSAAEPAEATGAAP